jgi:gas vesicle protein
MYGAETYDNAEVGGGNEFILGLLCGTAVGAAIGLLLAPKTGAELRHQLADSADRFRRRASETYGQASSAVNRAVEKGREVMDKGRDTARQARDQARDTMENARSSFETSGPGSAY